MLDDGENGEEPDRARELESEEDLDLAEVLAALRQIRSGRGFAWGRRAQATRLTGDEYGRLHTFTIEA